LSVRRVSGGYMAELIADVKSYKYSITYSGPDGKKQKLRL
jgi:hypothetical protein